MHDASSRPSPSVRDGRRLKGQEEEEAKGLEAEAPPGLGHRQPGDANSGCKLPELRLACSELKVFVRATSQKLSGFTRFYLVFFFSIVFPPPPHPIFVLVWSSSNRWGVFLTTFASRKRRENLAPVSDSAQLHPGEPLVSLPGVLIPTGTQPALPPPRRSSQPGCRRPCPPPGSALTCQHVPFDVPTLQIRTLKGQKEGGEVLPRPPGESHGGTDPSSGTRFSPGIHFPTF